MNWLVPAMISTLVGTLILCAVYIYLYFAYRNRFMLIWFFGWLFNAFRYVLDILSIHGNPPLAVIFTQVCALASGMLLLWGTMVFVGKKMRRFWIVVGLAGAAWIAVETLSNNSFAIITAPPYLLMSFIYILTGVLIFRSCTKGKISARIVGIVFIVWGIHKADYPILRYSDWFASAGYLIASVFSFTVALGMLLLFFERLQKELAQSEEAYRSIFNATSEAIFVHDAETGQIFDVNDSMLKMYRCTREQALAWKTADLSDDPDYGGDSAIRHIRLAAEEGERMFEWHSPRMDGTYFWSEVSLKRVTIGGRDRILAVVRDITSRKKGMEDLEKSQARNKALLDANPDLMFLLDDEGRYLEYNAPDTNLLYRRPDFFLGKTISEVLPPEVAKLTLEKIAEVHKTGKVATFEYVLDMNGPHYFESRIAPCGRKEFLAVIRDITRRKHDEEERLEMERKLLHVQKLESLGVLAGGLAHDFNNILMAILGHLELAMKQLPADSPVNGDLYEIEHAVQRAADLSRQMLAYSGKGKFVIERINLSRVVLDMIAMLKPAVSKKVELKLELDENLPDIEGDATQLRQVIMNLITNASEAIGENTGVVTVATGRVRLARKDFEGMIPGDKLEKGEYVLLEVKDTGCGMDEETLSKLFEPFFTTKFTGRGLGMAAVLGIIRGHKGAVRIDTHVGKGTRFRLYFPASDGRNTIPVTGGETDAVSHRNGGTVLFVDDESSIRSLAKIMLEKAGFEVLTASDGREALKTFGEFADRIDAVILDLTMPNMDGVEAMRELNALKPGVRVIVSSGYTESEISRRFAGQTVAGFLHKPYRMKELIDKTHALLRK